MNEMENAVTVKIYMICIAVFNYVICFHERLDGP